MLLYFPLSKSIRHNFAEAKKKRRSNISNQIQSILKCVYIYIYNVSTDTNIAYLKFGELVIVVRYF